ncbi:MAG: hypothetical protein ALECFALPRED_010125 [Alectoria fallacina]|uniref:Uncharacterized protein n=1 Tax=Alectoria fallacina TaxID=1903189 RepID=A0A8H3F6U6_9LECA|nr:MAG: hypothetical protein ALECFALPRED_010125 [Alectoria fallacina]
MLLRKLLVASFLLAPTISGSAYAQLPYLHMTKVNNSLVAVIAINDQDGVPMHNQPQHHSNVLRIETYRSHKKTQSTAPGRGRVIDSGIAVPTVDNQDGILIDYYTQYNGNGSTDDGWPSKDKWISFMDMFNNSRGHMEKSCRQFNVALNTQQEIVDVYKAIQFVAAATFVDHRFILAAVLQESGGCVRAPTSNYGVPNPGLMQDHNGTASCNKGRRAQKPCPREIITQMIQEGTGGTTWGDGLAQCLNQAGTSDVSAFYRAARIYNSGSIDESGDLGKGIATHCYASDIANRLTGWVQYPRNCTLDD